MTSLKQLSINFAKIVGGGGGGGDGDTFNSCVGCLLANPALGNALDSGKKKEPKPKLCWSGYFLVGMGAFHEKGGGGQKSSICPSEVP